MNRSEYLRAWSAAHGFAEDREVAGIARWYLSLNYLLVRPLLILRLPPNFVTLFAPVLATAALLADSALAIAFLILASLMVDGFDGAVAIIRGKSSAFGGVWDGIIDRVTELLWIGALYYAGISPALLLLIWVLVAPQEYGRAKLNQLVGNHLGVVTVCERPVRGLLVALGFLGEFFVSGSLVWVALVWLALQAIAFMQFSVTARKLLR